MFFQGQTSSTISLTQIMADVTGILTGTITSPAGLSASFLGGSTFITTIAPGWVLHDAAAGVAANGVTPIVLRAPVKGSGSMYKHVYIGSTAALQLVLNGYETWDNMSHTGTFPMVGTPASTSWQTITWATNTLVTISASANHIYIATATSHTVPTSLEMVAEYSRDDPWNTLANGYHSWVQTGLSTSVSAATANSAITRAYNAAGSADVAPILFSGAGTQPWGTISADFGVGFASPITSASGGGAIGAQIATSGPQAIDAADVNKNPTRSLYSVGARQCIPSGAFLGAWLGGSISTGTNGHFYFLAKDAATGGDVVQVGADEYYVARIPGFTSALLAIKRA